MHGAFRQLPVPLGILAPCTPSRTRLGLRESLTRRYDELAHALDEQLGFNPHARPGSCTGSYSGKVDACVNSPFAVRLTTASLPHQQCLAWVEGFDLRHGLVGRYCLVTDRDGNVLATHRPFAFISMVASSLPTTVQFNSLSVNDGRGRDSLPCDGYAVLPPRFHGGDLLLADGFPRWESRDHVAAVREAPPPVRTRCRLRQGSLVFRPRPSYRPYSGTNSGPHCRTLPTSRSFRPRYSFRP
jgi:hypothetical protein